MNRKKHADVVSIIIVTYNSERTIEACLGSALATSAPGDEILVVDNASSDSTAAIVGGFQAQFPSIRLVCNSHNVFYTRAANQGAEMARGDAFLLLNPDTILYPNWREVFLGLLARPSVGAVGPITNFVTGRQYVEFHLPPLSHRPSLDELPRVLSLYNSGTFESTKLLIGFCMMVSKRTIEQIGPLHERLELGGDDLEFSWRLRLHGLELLIAREVFVFHEGGESFKSLEQDAGDSLLKSSSDALFGILKEYYAPAAIPSSIALWGNPIFQPTLDRLSVDGPGD